MSYSYSVAIYRKPRWLKTRQTRQSTRSKTTYTHSSTTLLLCLFVCLPWIMQLRVCICCHSLISLFKWDVILVIRYSWCVICLCNIKPVSISDSLRIHILLNIWYILLIMIYVYIKDITLFILISFCLNWYLSIYLYIHIRKYPSVCSISFWTILQNNNDTDWSLFMCCGNAMRVKGELE